MIQSTKKLLLPIFCLTFLITNSISSQSNLTPIVVNTESKVALFSQHDARIFPDSNKGFLVSWVDSRNGDSKFYAQEYNPDLSPIGRNYETFTNTLISYSTSGKSFCIYDSTYSYQWFPWEYRTTKYFMGVIYDDYSNPKRFNIGGGSIPNFIEFWSGEGYSSVEYNNDFISVSDIGGRFQAHKIFENGTDSLIAQNDENDYSDISNTSIAINGNGEYTVAYLYNSDYSEPDSLNNSGIYVQVFSNTDSLICKQKIKPFIDYDYYSHFPAILATSISDSLFQIFVSDSSKVTSIIINKLGNILESNSYPVIIGDYEYFNWWERNTFTISNINGNKRALILSFNNMGKTYKNLFYIDKDGNFIGEPIIDSTSSFQYSSKIFMDENEHLIFTKTVAWDVYLYRCNNFDVIDSIKINDDISGSNEARPYIMRGENNGFYLYWVNEKNSVGQLINSNGNLVGENQILKNESFSFFNDGKRLEPWSKTLASGKKQMGFKIFDKDSNLVAMDSLAGENGSDEIKLSIKIVNDSEFIIGYFSEGKNYLAKYSKDGTEIKTIEIGYNSFYNTNIYFDEEYFYTKINQKLFKYDYNLNLIYTKDEFPYFSIYIGKSRFLSVATDYEFYNQITGTIYDENGEVINSEIDLGRQVHYSIRLAKSGQFILFTEMNGKLVANTFNSDGEKIISDFVVYTLNNEKVRNINFEVNGNKILFTWSGRKLDEGNYDIYAVVYDLDLVTGIKDNMENINYKFNLEQNYPNPFNPSTIIKYSIPSGVGTSRDLSLQNVEMTIYDILGKEVATLVNEKQSYGNYEVVFNAGKLSSGMYFAKLQYGSLSSVKKMILLK